MKESILKRFRSELEVLIKNGLELISEFSQKKINHLTLSQNYHAWFTESQSVVKQLIPNRLDDFNRMYRLESRKVIDAETYSINDFLVGISIKSTIGFLFDPAEVGISKLVQQISILKSAERVFQSSLWGMEQIVMADLFDSELDKARELLKHKFYRASGVLAGVVLESHLKKVLTGRNILIKKKDPTIADLNDYLKAEGIIEIPNWRFIQRLGDLRNLCGHDKDREPSKDECSELIDGVDKIIKTLF